MSATFGETLKWLDEWCSQGRTGAGNMAQRQRRDEMRWGEMATPLTSEARISFIGRDTHSD